MGAPPFDFRTRQLIWFAGVLVLSRVKRLERSSRWIAFNARVVAREGGGGDWTRMRGNSVATSGLVRPLSDFQQHGLILRDLADGAHADPAAGGSEDGLRNRIVPFYDHALAPVRRGTGCFR